MLSTDIAGLVILGFCIVLFLNPRISSAITGTLGCLLMVLFGVSDFETAFGGFSDSIVMLMFSAIVVGIAMFKTGAAQIMGRFLIRLAHGDEKTFLIISCIVTGSLSGFLANTAILAAMIPIIDSVCRISDKMKRKNLLLPVACSVMLGGACTLIGCTPQLTANALMMKMAGQEMGMWTLTLPGVIIFALFLLYLFFWGKNDGEKIWGDREEKDMGVAQEKIEAVLRPGDVDKRKLIVMFIIVTAMIVSYVVEIVPTSITAMCAAMLCVLTGCCTVKDIHEEMSWETVIFLGSCLGLGNALTEAGTGSLIGEGVTMLIGQTTSPMLIYAIMVIFTIVLSQFITNSTAIIISLPIALSLCDAYGFNPMTFCVGITFGASLSCCTPLAASQIAMTQVAGYEFKDYLKFCWKPTLIFIVGIIALVPLVYPLEILP